MSRQKLNELAISDSGFVFDPWSGATFNINATGLAILEGLKEDLGREGLLERLMSRFQVGEADLHRDIDEFVSQLRENGLLARDFQLETR